MKSLAGANPDAKPDYRSQALTELNKLEQKVILLNEMLDNVDTEKGEKFATGDAYDQVSSILITARPKLQKWVSDAETDDPESLDTFLQINDQINTVLSRYEAFKKGDFTFAANPIPQELSNNAASGSLSLIDLDDTPAAAEVPSNDLSGLFSQPIQLQQQPQPQPPQFSGFPSGFAPQPTFARIQAQQPPVMQPHAPTPLSHNGSAFGRPNSMSPPVTQSQSATPPASIALPGTPQPAPSQLPNYFGNGGTAPAGMGMGMGVGMGVGSGMQMGQSYGGIGQPQTFGGSPQPQPYGQHPMPQMVPQQQPQQASAAPPPTAATATATSAVAGQQSKDPFADLAGLF